MLSVMVTFLYFTRLQMVAALGKDLDLRAAAFARIDMIGVPLAIVWTALGLWLGHAQRARAAPESKPTTEGTAA